MIFVDEIQEDWKDICIYCKQEKSCAGCAQARNFEIGIEASEARAVVTESGTIDRFELFLKPSDLLLIIKSLSRYGELPRKNKVDVVHAQVLADTLGDFYTVQERKNHE